MRPSEEKEGLGDKQGRLECKLHVLSRGGRGHSAARRKYSLPPPPAPLGEQIPWSYHGYGLGQGGPPHLDQSQAWWRNHCFLREGIFSVLDTPFAGGTCRRVRGTEEAKSLSPSLGTLCDGQGAQEQPRHWQKFPTTVD